MVLVPQYAARNYTPLARTPNPNTTHACRTSDRRNVSAKRTKRPNATAPRSIPMCKSITAWRTLGLSGRWTAISHGWVSCSGYNYLRKCREQGVCLLQHRGQRYRRQKFCRAGIERPGCDIPYGARRKLHEDGHWRFEVSHRRARSKCCQFEQSRHTCSKNVSSYGLTLQERRLSDGIET